MGEFCVESCNASRFIESLSKSIQALCHGYMEFDDSIQMIGYINISIDSGKMLDCILNEKVRKSDANSISCVSNSFQAKKQKPKQTKDSSCSPIPQAELNPPVPQPPFKRQYPGSGNDQRELAPVRKRQRPNYSSSPGSVFSQNQYATSESSSYNNSTTTSSETVGSENLTIKSETGNSTVDDSSTPSQDIAVKTEANVPTDSYISQSTENFIENDPQTETTTPVYEQHENQPSTSASIHYDNTAGSSNAFQNYDEIQDSQYGDESTTESDKFEVIEIGDDDEEGQMFFGQPENKVWPLVDSLKNFTKSHISEPSTCRQSPFTCSRCPGLTFNRLEFQHHMQQYHLKDMPFFCDLCVKGFFTKSGLQNHMIAHSGRLYSCSLCSKQYSHLPNLYRHTRKSHQRTLCKTCGMTFSPEHFREHSSQCSSLKF